MGKKAAAPKPVGDERRVSDLIHQIAFMVDLLVLFFFGLYLAVRPLIPQAEAAGLGVDALTKVFICTAFLLWLLKSNLQGGLRGVWSGAAWALLAFLAWALLAAGSWADYRYQALLRVADWGCDGLAFWLALQYARSAAGARFLLRILVATAVVVACYGLYQYLHGFDVMRNSAEALKWQQQLPEDMREGAKLRLSSNRVFSTFVLANHFAIYLALLLPTLIVGLFRARIAASRGAQALLLVLFGIGIGLSGSKGTMLALAVALVAGAFAYRKLLLRHPRIGVAIGTCAALLIGGYILILNKVGPFGTVRDRLGDALPTPSVLYDTIKVRLGYWQAALGALEAEPGAWLTGYGPDQYRGLHPTYRPSAGGQTRYTHNDYLQLLVELGLPGLLAYLAFQLLVGWRLVTARRGEEDDEDEEAEAERERGVDPVTLEVLTFSPLIIAAVGVCAFVFIGAMNISFILPEPEGGRQWARIFGVLGLTLWLAAAYAIQPDVGKPGLWGLGIGLLAFALHQLVDFDLYVCQLSSIAFAVAGLALGLAARRVGQRRLSADFPLWGQLACGLALLGPFYVLTNVWLPRTVRYEAKRAEAQSAVDSKVPGQAINAMQEALEAVPWDVRTLVELSNIESAHGQSIFRARSYKAFLRNTQRWSEATLRNPNGLLEHALRLDPTASGIHRDLARWHEAMSELLRRERSILPATHARYRALSRQILASRGRALWHYREALRLNPHHPGYHMRLSALLDHEDLAGHALLVARVSWPWPQAPRPVYAVKPEPEAWTEVVKAVKGRRERVSEGPGKALADATQDLPGADLIAGGRTVESATVMVRVPVAQLEAARAELEARVGRLSLPAGARPAVVVVGDSREADALARRALELHAERDSRDSLRLSFKALKHIHEQLGLEPPEPPQ